MDRLGEDGRSRYFCGVVDILYQAFPKQELGCPMEKDWPQCQLHINHVLAALGCYQDYDIQAEGLEKFAEILFNCGWYVP